MSTNTPANSASERWLALIAVILGAFVAILNNSLINVAIPKLMATFGSTTDEIQWVLTGFMLSSGIVVPLSGYLGERIGYKKFLIYALSLFTAGSLLCGLAWSATSLIAFRIIQGIGGGVIMPVSMAIIYKVMPREQIGTALGIWGIAAMVAPAVGPTLSGYIIDYTSWRFLFFINVPVAIFAIVMSSILLKETQPNPNLTFDFAGFFFSALSAGCLLYGLSKGQSEGWTSLYIVSFFFVAFFSLLLLVWVEKGKQNPLIDLSLFANAAFSVSVITSSLVMIGLYGGVFLTPLFLQNIQGLDAVQTGLILMPQAIVMAIMMPIAGKLNDRFGIVPIGLVGLSVLGAATYEMHRLTADTPHSWLIAVLTIRGFGIGLCMMPLTSAGMNAVAPQQVGRASALSNLIRQICASMGIAVLTTIMQNRLSLHTSHISDSVSLSSDVANQSISLLASTFIQSGLDTNSATGAALSLLSGLVAKEATVRAIADTFLISAAPVFLSIPFVFLLRKKKAAADSDRTNPQARPAKAVS